MLALTYLGELGCDVGQRLTANRRRGRQAQLHFPWMLGVFIPVTNVHGARDLDSHSDPVFPRFRRTT